MTNTNKGLIIAAIIIILLAKPKMGKAELRSNMVNISKFSGDVQLKLAIIISELANIGLNKLQIKFAISQILFETGQFSTKSEVSKLNNNYSGIKYINKPYQIATQGSDVPKKEKIRPATAPLNFYAKFANVGQWAKDYVRILNLGKNKPLQADTLVNYHARLTANRYYDTRLQKSRDNYYKGLLRYYNILS